MVIKLDKHVNGLFVKQHARNLKDEDEGPNNNRRFCEIIFLKILSIQMKENE